MAKDSAPPDDSGIEDRQVENGPGPGQGEEKGRDRSSIPRSDEGLEAKKPEDIPPDGGYGWVCVVCACLINANTWGVNSVSSSSPICTYLPGMSNVWVN